MYPMCFKQEAKSQKEHKVVLHTMTAEGEADDGTSGAEVPANKQYTVVVGSLSRSLGGGASVHFEHDNPDHGGKVN